MRFFLTHTFNSQNRFCTQTVDNKLSHELLSLPFNWTSNDWLSSSDWGFFKLPPHSQEMRGDLSGLALFSNQDYSQTALRPL